MAHYKTFEAILENAEESEALDYARGMVWSEVGVQHDCSIAYARYIDTVNNEVDVYYDYGADYYFFCPTESSWEAMVRERDPFYDVA